MTLNLDHLVQCRWNNSFISDGDRYEIIQMGSAESCILERLTGCVTWTRPVIQCRAAIHHSSLYQGVHSTNMVFTVLLPSCSVFAEQHALSKIPELLLYPVEITICSNGVPQNCFDTASCYVSICVLKQFLTLPIRYYNKRKFCMTILYLQLYGR